MVHVENPLKVVFGDELAPLTSLLEANHDPNLKVLVLLPSYISINNCQQALLREIKTIQNVIFTTFDDLSLRILDESSGLPYDFLDDEVEREATARALAETGLPANISEDLRASPSFITYMSSVLFELRRNAESISVEKCLLPKGLGNGKYLDGLSEFEREKLTGRAELSGKLIDGQWKILQPAFKERYYTRELAIAEATKVLAGPSGSESLPGISQVFIGHPYHVDDVLFRFIVSIARLRPTTYRVATSNKDDNISERLKNEIGLEIETVRPKGPTKSAPVAAPDIRREIQYLARDVHRRVSKGELKLSDILAVARDSGQYEDMFYEVMGEFEIPAEVQTRQYFKLLAVSHFYDSLLKFASGSDREMAEALVEILETGYPGVSEYSTYWMRAKIERLRTSFSGLLSDLKARNPADPIGGRPASWWLDQFEKLQKVKERLQKAESVEDFLKVLISSEPKMGIVEYTSRRLREEDATSVPKGVRARELEGTLRLLRRLWRMKEAQDQINEAMGTKKVDVKRLRELFEDFLATESYGSGSQSREVLRLVDAGNIDFLRPQLMYMVGMSEGVFPSKMRETAFLGDRACKLLTENGVAYLQNSDTTRGYEKWIFSNCLGTSQEGLEFTYSYLDTEGHPRLYSPFFLSDGLFEVKDLEQAIRERILADSFVGEEATADRDALRLAAGLLGREASRNEQWEIKFNDPELEKAFATTASGSRRVKDPPSAAELGSAIGNRRTKFDIDALNEFAACQFRYYSKYLLDLNPWNSKPHLRLRKFYSRVLEDLIPKLPEINPTVLRRKVNEELEQRVKSDDIPNERLMRRLSAIIYGYLASEVQRNQSASSSIASRKMEYARPVTLSVEGFDFEGAYDRVDFLDDDTCLVCEMRETAQDVRSSFFGINLGPAERLSDYRLPFLIGQLRRDGKKVIGVEYHSMRPSTNWLPRQAGFVIKSYAKSVAAPDSVVSVSQAQFDWIANESMKRALVHARSIAEATRFSVQPIRRDLCDSCTFDNLCLGPGGIRE